MRFQHPTNGYVEASSVPFLWALVFGPFYFVLKGVWRHVVLYFVFNSVLFSIVSFLAGGAGMLAMSFLTPAAMQGLSQGAIDPTRTAIMVGVVVGALVLPFLIYPFIASGIVRRHYLRQGWIELDL